MNYELKFKYKSEYRLWAKKIRSELDLYSISKNIQENIRKLEEYKKSNNIAMFYPLPQEINLFGLFEDFSKHWFLPRIDYRLNMEFYEWKPGDKLEANKFGVPEPLAIKKLDIYSLDIIIIPALTVDKSGFRIGYGKGYYDRFLTRIKKNCIKLVPVADELFVEEIPKDNFDIPANIVITQTKIFYMR
jgi:5-formyltetrahydrofolate cyclo-ligase